MTQPTLDACSRFPTDFPQEEELPEQTQQAQATTAGPLVDIFDTTIWDFSVVLEPAT